LLTTNDVKMNVLLDQPQNDMLLVAVAHAVWLCSWCNFLC